MTRGGGGESHPNGSCDGSRRRAVGSGGGRRDHGRCSHMAASARARDRPHLKYGPPPRGGPSAAGHWRRRAPARQDTRTREGQRGGRRVGLGRAAAAAASPGHWPPRPARVSDARGWSEAGAPPPPPNVSLQTGHVASRRTRAWRVSPPPQRCSPRPRPTTPPPRPQLHIHGPNPPPAAATAWRLGRTGSAGVQSAPPPARAAAAAAIAGQWRCRRGPSCTAAVPRAGGAGGGGGGGEAQGTRSGRCQEDGGRRTRCKTIESML